MGLGPNSAKPFWDQDQPFWGLENVQTPFLPGPNALSITPGPSKWQSCASPLQNRVPQAGWAPAPPVPACFLARNDQAPAVGKQPGPPLLPQRRQKSPGPQHPGRDAAGVLWSWFPTPPPAPACVAVPACGCCMSGLGLGCCTAPLPVPTGKIKIWSCPRPVPCFL